MTLSEKAVIAALVEVINSPTRPPALYPLARLRYPQRELRPALTQDGALTVTLAFYGWEYKHRGPRPKKQPFVNPALVKAALDPHLPDGVVVTNVRNEGKFIRLTMR